MTTGQRIGELATAKNINLHKLAEIAQIPYNTLYSIVRRKSDKVDLDTVRKIALALDAHPLEILGDSSLELIEYGLDIMKRGLDAAEEALEIGKKTFKTDDGFAGKLEYISQADHDKIKRKKCLLAAFKRLNTHGQKIAIDRVEELTQIPKYRQDDAPQDTSGTSEDNNTPKTKKPSEGNTQPPNGT